VEPRLSQSGMLGILAIDGNGNRNAKTIRLNDKLLEYGADKVDGVAIVAIVGGKAEVLESKNLIHGSCEIKLLSHFTP
jgi:hypothetical protein